MKNWKKKMNMWLFCKLYRSTVQMMIKNSEVRQFSAIVLPKNDERWRRINTNVLTVEKFPFSYYNTCVNTCKIQTSFLVLFFTSGKEYWTIFSFLFFFLAILKNFSAVKSTTINYCLLYQNNNKNKTLHSLSPELIFFLVFPFFYTLLLHNTHQVCPQTNLTKKYNLKHQRTLKWQMILNTAQNNHCFVSHQVFWIS